MNIERNAANAITQARGESGSVGRMRKMIERKDALAPPEVPADAYAFWVSALSRIVYGSRGAEERRRKCRILFAPPLCGKPARPW